jgi:NADPH-dependent 7-cyano-7-deazaguanine reductase QueF
MEDFVAACDPLKVKIEGDFHVRGNIKTVVRAEYKRKKDKKRDKKRPDSIELVEVAAG